MLEMFSENFNSSYPLFCSQASIQIPNLFIFVVFFNPQWTLQNPFLPFFSDNFSLCELTAATNPVENLVIWVSLCMLTYAGILLFSFLYLSVSLDIVDFTGIFLEQFFIVSVLMAEITIN